MGDINNYLVPVDRGCIFQVPRSTTLADSRATRAIVKGSELTLLCNRCGQFVLNRERLLNLIDVLLCSDKTVKLINQMATDEKLFFSSTYDAEDEVTSVKLFYKDKPLDSTTYKLNDAELMQFERCAFIPERFLRLFIAFRNANENTRIEILDMLIEAEKHLTKY